MRAGSGAGMGYAGNWRSRFDLPVSFVRSTTIFANSSKTHRTPYIAFWNSGPVHYLTPFIPPPPPPLRYRRTSFSLWQGVIHIHHHSLQSVNFTTGLHFSIGDECQIHTRCRLNHSAMISPTTVPSSLPTAISTAATFLLHAPDSIGFLQLWTGNGQGGSLRTGRLEKRSTPLREMKSGLKDIYRWFWISTLAPGIHGAIIGAMGC